MSSCSDISKAGGHISKAGGHGAEARLVCGLAKP